MSLKAVELQVALPRTVEAGRLLEQQQNRTHHEQQALMNERTMLDDHVRQRPPEIEQTAHNQIREREQQRKQQDQADASFSEAVEGQPSEEKTASQPLMRDPLRGRYIDISL